MGILKKSLKFSLKWNRVELILIGQLKLLQNLNWLLTKTTIPRLWVSEINSSFKKRLGSDRRDFVFGKSFLSYALN